MTDARHGAGPAPADDLASILELASKSLSDAARRGTFAWAPGDAKTVARLAAQLLEAVNTANARRRQ